MKKVAQGQHKDWTGTFAFKLAELVGQRLSTGGMVSIRGRLP
jgi:hypothetical protein